MRTSILAAALVAAMATTPALAHWAADGDSDRAALHGSMMGPGMMMGSGMMMGPGMMMGGDRHIEGRLAFLKTELAITDAQAPQWTRFADVLRAQAKRSQDSQAMPMRQGAMQPGMMQPGTMQPGTMQPGMMQKGMTGQAGAGKPGAMMPGQGMPGQGMSGQGMAGQGMAGQGMAMTVPDRLARMEAALAARLEALRALKGPAEELYAVLDEQQKQTADQLLLSPMGMMGMM